MSALIQPHSFTDMTATPTAARAALPELLHEGFERHAEATPHRIAIDGATGPVTYRELDRRADAMAAYLTGSGIAAGDVVAILQDRSSDLAAALLGISKAGATGLPLDPAADRAETEVLIAQWQPRMVLATKDAARAVSLPADTTLVLVDDEPDAFDAIAGQATFGKGVAIASADPSLIARRQIGRQHPDTGVVSHSDAVKFAASLATVYGLEAADRLHQDLRIDLDVAVEEILAVLSIGATVVFTADIGTAMTDKTANAVSTVPAGLQGLDASNGAPAILIVGGERLDDESAAAWAMRAARLVTVKGRDDRIASFTIESDDDIAWKPRLLHTRTLRAA